MVLNNFKMVEHLQALLLIMTAQCIIWNIPLPYFSPFHTDTFCPFFFLNLKDKTKACFLLPGELSTILGSNK